MPQTPEEQQVSRVAERLRKADKYEILPEAVLAALRAMKENPSLSVDEALDEGCREWDV